MEMNMNILKTVIVAASLVAFSGAVMAAEAPKTDAKACVADATHKCPAHSKAKKKASN